MTDSKIRVSIGIPAHNESQTIGAILHDLKKQKQTNFTLKEIIVVSDGSTDDTENEVKKVKSPFIHLYKNKTRLGLAKTLNTISAKANGDILIILNADIYINDTFLLHTLIQPIIQGKADLVAGQIKNTKPTHFVETILAKSCEIKENLYEKLNNGDNVYTLHGPVRAFNKKFYKSFRLVEDIADDMYTYYYAKANGYRYVYVPQAMVYFKLPNSISDHVKQSKRFLASLKNAHKQFGKFVFKRSADEKMLPYIFLLQFFLQNPFYCILYLGIQSMVFYQTIFSESRFKQQWEIINSSKLLYEF